MFDVQVFHPFVCLSFYKALIRFSAEPINSDLAPRTRFSKMNKEKNFAYLAALREKNYFYEFVNFMKT